MVLSLAEERRGVLVGVSGDGVADLRVRERKKKRKEDGEVSFDANEGEKG